MRLGRPENAIGSVPPDDGLGRLCESGRPYVRNGQYGPPTMRLVVARCEVLYTGRLTARLPEALRLLMLKADGSLLVHDDAGGFRPLNRGWSVFRPATGRIGRCEPESGQPDS